MARSDVETLAGLLERARQAHQSVVAVLVDVRATAPQQAEAAVRYLRSADLAMSSAVAKLLAIALTATNSKGIPDETPPAL